MPRNSTSASHSCSDSDQEACDQHSYRMQESDIDSASECMSSCCSHEHIPSMASMASGSSMVSIDSRHASEAPVANQGRLRKLILEIQSDSALTPPEKAKQIQALMSSKWHSHQQQKTTHLSNKLIDKNTDFGHVSELDMEPSYHVCPILTKDANAKILGCKHYMRGSKLQAHCCGRWFACRFCHDEVSDHQIVRYALH